MRFEELPQPRDVLLQRRACVVRRLLAPQLVDQSIRRDDDSGIEQQDCEHAALLRAPRGRASARRPPPRAARGSESRGCSPGAEPTTRRVSHLTARRQLAGRGRGHGVRIQFHEQGGIDMKLITLLGALVVVSAVLAGAAPAGPQPVRPDDRAVHGVGAVANVGVTQPVRPDDRLGLLELGAARRSSPQRAARRPVCCRTARMCPRRGRPVSARRRRVRPGRCHDRCLRRPRLLPRPALVSCGMADASHGESGSSPPDDFSSPCVAAHGRLRPPVERFRFISNSHFTL